MQGLSKALLPCDALEPCSTLAFNLNVIGEAPLIMNHTQPRLPPPSPELGAAVFSTHRLSLSLFLFPPLYTSTSHKENVSHVQWSDAKEQGPLLGPERVGQCVSAAQSGRNGGGGGGRV